MLQLPGAFFDGKSMKEIGAALGVSEDAVKMHADRAVAPATDSDHSGMPDTGKPRMALIQMTRAMELR
jgi:hypothetical protein